MTLSRRLALASACVAAAAVIVSAAFTTYHALGRTVTVTVCGHSYQVREGGSLTVDVGMSCASTRVSGP